MKIAKPINNSMKFDQFRDYKIVYGINDRLTISRVLEAGNLSMMIRLNQYRYLMSNPTTPYDM